MNVEIVIRPAQQRDAHGISQIIQGALRETNSKDYPASVINRLVKNFDPTDIENFIPKRIVFVALFDHRIVGTASLDQDVVRTVFIAPDMQRQGIGRMLMAKIAEVAQNTSLPLLFVPSSITAVSFYKKLGFHHVREEFHDEEKTIIMKRELVA